MQNFLRASADRLKTCLTMKVSKVMFGNWLECSLKGRCNISKHLGLLQGTVDPVSNLISMTITSAVKSPTAVGGNVFGISAKTSVPLQRHCLYEMIPMTTACSHL